MRLAAELKVPVPAVDLLHLAPSRSMSSNGLIVSRPKRKGAAGNAIRRLHQIDLCQALGRFTSKKYESEGGLGLHHLFEVVRSTFIDRPIVAPMQLCSGLPSTT
jgi:serine/threonine-protein kinase HipA